MNCHHCLSVVKIGPFFSLGNLTICCLACPLACLSFNRSIYLCCSCFQLHHCIKLCQFFGLSMRHPWVHLFTNPALFFFYLTLICQCLTTQKPRKIKRKQKRRLSGFFHRRGRCPEVVFIFSSFLVLICTQEKILFVLYIYSFYRV